MVEKGVKQSYQWTNVGNQYFAVLIVSLMNILAGIGVGWMTPMVPVLMADDSPTGPLTTEEISWISASFSVGSTSGSFICSWLTALIGSKRSSISLMIPCMGFIFFIYFGHTFVNMLIGRILAGFVTGGVLSNIVIYTSEIANNDVRGKFGSCGQLSRYFGILVCFIVSSFLGYEHIPVISVFLPLAFFLIFIFLPNTPQFYLRRNRIEEAEKALKFYKSFKGDTIEETTAIIAEFERIKEIEKIRKRDEKLQLSDVCNRQALKGFLNGVVLGLLVNLSANFVLLTYAIPVFEASGTKWNLDYSMILMPVCMVAGCICSVQLSDKLGRKCMIIVSLIGGGISLAVFAAYVQLYNANVDVSAFHWIPVVTVLLVMFLASGGIVTLGVLATIEPLPTKIRDVGLGVYLFVMNSSSVVILKLFPFWWEVLGLPGTLMIHSVTCLLGAVYVLLFVPEMKGKPIDNIQLQSRK